MLFSDEEDNDHWSDEDDPYPEVDDEEPESPMPEWNRQRTPPRQQPPPQGRRNTRILVCRCRGLIVVTYTDLDGEIVIVDLTGEESEREHSPGVPAVVQVPAVRVSLRSRPLLIEGHFR